MNKRIMRALLCGATVLLVAGAYSYSEGPDPGNTGAPGETTCNQPGCHNSFPLNSGGGSVTISGAPTAYVPDATYTISVQDQKKGQQRWGFELTAKKSDRTGAGNFQLLDPVDTQIIT